MHHFSAGGLYDGLILLVDDETRSYWNHVTGEAVHGPLVGERLATWNLDYTTAGAALVADPTLSLSRSGRGLVARLMGFMHRRKIGTAGFLPPGFRSTMGAEDKRLTPMTQGLGVMFEREQRFYPVAALTGGAVTEFVGSRQLRVALGEVDRVPRAVWQDDGTSPRQLFTRWYGFSFTFHGCSIHGEPKP